MQTEGLSVWPSQSYTGSVVGTQSILNVGADYEKSKERQVPGTGSDHDVHTIKNSATSNGDTTVHIVSLPVLS